MFDYHGREFGDESDEYSDDETAYTTKRREEAVAVLRSLKSVAGKSDIDGFWDDYADVVFQKPDNTVIRYDQCDENRVELIDLLLNKDTEITKRTGPPGITRPSVATFLDLKYVVSKEVQGSAVEYIYSVYSEHERSRSAYLEKLDAWKKSPEAKTRTTKNELSNPEVLATNSEKILTKLKLHYMRTRDVDLAISFLYGKNIHDVHICFDYVGPRTIKDEEFTRRFGKDSNSGLKFDEVLSYVRFPPVTVELTGRQNAERLGRPNGKLSGHQNRGRHDMEFFFKWLHDKGVRRILTVEVDDRVDAAHGDSICNEVPHSDESIQASLENIVVEHLNWRKTDLDPQVICQANPQKGSQRNNSNASHDYPPQIRSDLREVTLQWSGNIAALRAWSEPEGLPQLPKLEVVNLDSPSLPRAIEAALEKKATIISMSWTIPLPKDGTREKFKLDAVLQKACKQKVLMFCSPPDSLAKEDHYPWAYKPESMFLIGAAHSDGTQYNLAGNKVNYTFPGVNVNLGFGTTQRKGLTKSIALTKESTGSSIATALAAGLAALITSCFKASAIRLITEQSNSYNPKSARPSPSDVERMTQQQVMKEAFARIGNKDRSKFIQVWKMIPPDSPFFDEDKEYEDKMAAVIEFCVSIYSHN
ncbi:hypothetical protein K4K54_008892 [Colletotrichum sp. SAR 10_86]|nr:hypothetical protein K4K54_008892 [Colletotrichum sp. SAR 10_86]